MEGPARSTRTARFVDAVLAARDPATLERVLLAAALACGAGAAAIWRDTGTGFLPARERGTVELLPEPLRARQALRDASTPLGPGQRVLVGGTHASRLGLVLGGLLVGDCELDLLEALLTVAAADSPDPYAA